MSYIPTFRNGPSRCHLTRTVFVRTSGYQIVWADQWPAWDNDLEIGDEGGFDHGSSGRCAQGHAYRGTEGEICGGNDNWGSTDVEVWYPHGGH